MASPHAELEDNHLSWLLQGVDLLATTSDDQDKQREVKHDKQQFRRCQAHIIQSLEGGRVHALMMQQTSQCAPWMRQLMVGAAKVLTPVSGHSSGADVFSQQEGEDEHQKSVSYTVDKRNGKHVVTSVIRHKPTSTPMSAPIGDNAEMIESQQHHHAHFKDGQHTESNGATNMKIMRRDPLPETPEDQKLPRTYGAQQPERTNIEHTMDHKITLLRTEDLKSKPPRQSLTAELFTVQQTNSEVKWIRLNHHTVLPPAATTMVSQDSRTLLSFPHHSVCVTHWMTMLILWAVQVQGMTKARKLLALQDLEARLTAGSTVTEVKGAEALLETADVSKHLIDEFKAGVRQETDTNVQLINALGSNSGQSDIAAGLVAIAQSDKAPMAIRHQALLSLLQLSCHTREHVIRALDQLEIADDNDFVASQAKLIQHGAMAHWAHCTDNKAAEHQIMDQVSSRTESSLLQALDNGDYKTAEVELTALSNSQLSRHAEAVVQALDSHHPIDIHLQAIHALGRIHGSVARQKVIQMRNHPGSKVLRSIAEKAYNGEYLLQDDQRNIQQDEVLKRLLTAEPAFKTPEKPIGLSKDEDASLKVLRNMEERANMKKRKDMTPTEQDAYDKKERKELDKLRRSVSLQKSEDDRKAAEQAQIKAAKLKQDMQETLKKNLDTAEKNKKLKDLNKELNNLKKPKSASSSKIGITIKKEWTFPSDGDFAVKLGAGIEVGMDNGELGMVASGAGTAILWGRSFDVLQIGMSKEHKGFFANLLGVLVFKYALWGGEKGKGGFTNGLKGFSKCKAANKKDMKNTDELDDAKDSCGFAANMATVFNSVWPFGENDANPSEDEQGRCRTDLSGRTNQANAAYNGIKGQIVREISKWVLCKQWTVTPIGIPLSLSVDITPTWGFDFSMGLGGPNEQQTCFMKKLPSGNCPVKSCRLLDDPEEVKQSEDYKKLTPCSAFDKRPGTQQGPIEDDSRLGDFCIYFATKVNDIRDIAGVTTGQKRGVKSDIEFTCHPGAVETGQIEGRDMPKVGGVATECADCVSNGKETKDICTCTSDEKTELQKLQKMYPWVLKGGEGADPANRLSQKCVGQKYYKQKKEGFDNNKVLLGALFNSPAGYLVMVTPLICLVFSPSSLDSSLHSAHCWHDLCSTHALHHPCMCAGRTLLKSGTQDSRCYRFWCPSSWDWSFN